MAEKEKFQGWIASLSDGSTVFENHDDYNGKTHWESLVEFCCASRISITRLRLQILGITIMSIPYAQGYVQCRQIRPSTSGNDCDMQGIGTIIGSVVMFTWIDSSRNVWQDIKSLDDFRNCAFLKSW